MSGLPGGGKSSPESRGTHAGYLFAGGQERILDLMNRQDLFVPFELADGDILILNKTEIASIKPFDRERMNGVDGHSAPAYLGQ